MSAFISPSVAQNSDHEDGSGDEHGDDPKDTEMAKDGEVCVFR